MDCPDLHDDQYWKTFREVNKDRIYEALAWEFLRRNADYCKDYDKLKKDFPNLIVSCGLVISYGFSFRMSYWKYKGLALPEYLNTPEKLSSELVIAENQGFAKRISEIIDKYFDGNFENNMLPAPSYPSYNIATEENVSLSSLIYSGYLLSNTGRGVTHSLPMAEEMLKRLEDKNMRKKFVDSCVSSRNHKYRFVARCDFETIISFNLHGDINKQISDAKRILRRLQKELEAAEGNEKIFSTRKSDPEILINSIRAYDAYYAGHDVSTITEVLFPGKVQEHDNAYNRASKMIDGGYKNLIRNKMK